MLSNPGIPELPECCLRSQGAQSSRMSIWTNDIVSYPAVSSMNQDKHFHDPVSHNPLGDTERSSSSEGLHT